MKKKFLSIFIFIFHILLYSCGSSNGATLTMLNDYQFSENIKEIYELRLTMNKDYTYEYSYKFPEINDQKEIDVEIKDKRECVLSFNYTYTFDDLVLLHKVKRTMNGDVGVYKLYNNFNENNIQQYLVLHINTYYLWTTNEEVSRSYLESLRGEGYTGYDIKDGYIDFWGTRLYPRGNINAKWQ